MDQAEGLRNMVNGTPVDFKALRPGSTALLPPANSPQVISISSGKGGVGKTNIVANLALALTRLGKKVLILDADLGLANIDILLGLTPRYTIEHLLTGQKRLQEVLVFWSGRDGDPPGRFQNTELADEMKAKNFFS